MINPSHPEGKPWTRAEPVWRRLTGRALAGRSPRTTHWPDGEPNGIVALPPEWIRDDAVYWNMHRFYALRPGTPPSGMLEVFLAEFDGDWEEGGMFLLTMQPHCNGHRSRLPVLERAITHARARGGRWFATHGKTSASCQDRAAA